MRGGLLAAFLALPARSWAGEAFPEVRMDARFELLGVVQLLAEADKRLAGFYRHEIPYVNSAQARFGRFSRHPVVERFSELGQKGLTYLQAYEFVHSLGDPPELKAPGWFPEDLTARMGGPEGAEEFRLLLSDFARVSDFMRFYEDSAPERESILEEHRRRIPGMMVRERLEAYTGVPVRLRYTLILSPFAEPVLAATFSRRDPDGTPHVESLLGLEVVYEDKPQRWHQIRPPHLWREILASQLSELSEPFRERLKATERLYAPLGASCASSWHSCAQRHIAFAAACRLLGLHLDSKAAAEWPVKYARIGLPYLGPLVKRLKEYESSREKYQTLLDFYPRLLEALEEIQERPKPPFLGGIEAVAKSQGPFALILPTREREGLSERLRLRAEETGLSRRAQVLSDTEALSEDLSAKTLVVIGTLRGNLWLRRHFQDLKLPVRFSGSGLALARRPDDGRDYRFQGRRLGLVSAALNPFDESRGLLLYSSQDPDLLPELLGLDFGPADYAILDGTRPLKVGLYEKSRRPWRVK